MDDTIEEVLLQDELMNSNDNFGDVLSLTLNTLTNYKYTMQNMLTYMLDNKIFNTHVVTEDEYGLKYGLKICHKNKNSVNLCHLGAYKRIKKDDIILNEQCGICFCDYEVGEYKRELYGCNHIFHKKCIDKWFRLNSEKMECPLCRKSYNPVIDIDLIRNYKPKDNENNNNKENNNNVNNDDIEKNDN